MKNFIALIASMVILCAVSARAQTVISSIPMTTPVYVEPTLPVGTASAPAAHTVYCGWFRRQAYSAQPVYYAPQPVGMQPIAGATPYGGGYYGGDCCSATTAMVQPPAPAYAPAAGCSAPVVLGQSPPNHYIGRGIVGQPKLYVSGQPLRNALRFITP